MPLCAATERVDCAAVTRYGLLCLPFLSTLAGLPLLIACGSPSDPEPSCLSISATVTGGHIQVDTARLQAEVDGVPFGRQKLARARESYEEARDAFSAHQGLAERCPQAWRRLGELAAAINELERDLDRTPTPPTNTASGLGQEVGRIAMAEGERVCDARVANNERRHSPSRPAAAFVVWLISSGGAHRFLLVNEVANSGNWSGTINVPRSDTYTVEVHAADFASWTVRCR